MDPRADRRLHRRSGAFYAGLIEDLVAFAAHEFYLEKPIGPDGSQATRREHLEQAERTLGVDLEELDGPELPVGLEYLWSRFLRLSGARSGGVSGPNPLSYTEIASFAMLSGERFKPWEVEALRAVDIAFLEEIGK